MTFSQHLDDLKWLFYERGMQSTWNFLKHVSSATTVGTFVAGAGMIGAIELDAATNPGLTAAISETLHGSGQQNNVTSTQFPFGDGYVPKVPPTNYPTS
jgi:hypothetical protein